MCKVAASIFLERALKNAKEESVISQSASISCGTILPAFLFAFLHAAFWTETTTTTTAITTTTAAPVSSAALRDLLSRESAGISLTRLLSPAVSNDREGNPFTGLTPLTITLLFYLLIKNWFSNVIVKRYSAVVKYVIYALAVAITYCWEMAMFSGEDTAVTTTSTGAPGAEASSTAAPEPAKDYESFRIIRFVSVMVVVQGVILFADSAPQKKK